jgi:hypothetical protein
MSNDAIRNRFSTHFAEKLYSEFRHDSEDQYLLFVGRVSPWGDENAPDGSTDSIYHNNYAWRNAIALKRIDLSDISHVIPRYDWTSGTAYTEYDDNTNPEGTSYYVLTDELNVYKCIYNNSGANSTAKPSSTGSEIVTTDDGYRWKFMFRVTDDSKKFLTKEYIPLEHIKSEPPTGDDKGLQWNIQTSTIDGAIEDIRVGTTGDTVYASSTQSSAFIGEKFGDANDAGQNTVILNFSASDSDDFYNNYVLYIDGGAGQEIGQVKRITDYVGAERKAILHENLDSSLQQSVSTYVIRPEIVISGNGTGAKVIPTLHDNNTIKDTKTIDAGSGYDFATARITTTESSGSLDPTISLEISPKGGHGINPLYDFESSRILISIKTDGNEGGLFSVANDFRQFGIIKNPIVATGPFEGQVAGKNSVNLTEMVIKKPYNISASDYDYSIVDGTFNSDNFIMGNSSHSTAKIESWRSASDSNNEGVLEVSSIKGGFSGPVQDKNLIRVNVNTDLGTGNFTIGEKIKQTTGTTGGNAEGKVNSWKSNLNELIIEVTKNSFSETTGGITGDTSGAGYGPPFLDFGVAGGELIKQFKSGATGYFELTSIAGNTQDYGRILSINDVVKNKSINTVYRQTHKLTISGSSLTTTTFEQDAGFTQQDGGATTGSLRYATGNVAEWDYVSGTTGALHLTNIVGSFTGGSYIDSGTDTITRIEIPELIIGSGEILYIQNIKPIKRNLEQKEEFKILIGF